MRHISLVCGRYGLPWINWIAAQMAAEITVEKGNKEKRGHQQFSGVN